jgi:hypothetical protein
MARCHLQVDFWFVWNPGSKRPFSAIAQELIQEIRVFEAVSLRILRSSVNVYGSGGGALNCLLKFCWL